MAKLGSAVSDGHWRCRLSAAFPAPGAPTAPPPWKQWLATVAVLYPLSLVMTPLVTWLADLVGATAWPPLRTLLNLLVDVGLLTFLIMPRWTRLIRGWLYRTAPHRRPIPGRR